MTQIPSALNACTRVEESERGSDLDMGRKGRNALGLNSFAAGVEEPEPTVFGAKPDLKGAGFEAECPFLRH